MVVKIRLTRIGKKKKPFYRIIISNSLSPRDGRFIEKIGTYNPIIKKKNHQKLIINLKKVLYWLNEGAMPSNKIIYFLKNYFDNFFTKKISFFINKRYK